MKNNLKHDAVKFGKEANTGFWKRLGSFIFDLLVINLVVFWPFEKVFSEYFDGSITQGIFMAESGLPGRLVFAMFIISMLALLYFTFMEYYLGQTIGQMFMNIQATSTGKGVGFWKALIRNCFILPFFPFYILWIIEPLHLIVYKQRLLERLTGTRTVDISSNMKYYQEFKLQKV